MRWLYTHDLSPFAFSVEVAGRTVGLRWYGLAYVLGFLLAFWYFRRAQRNGTIPGLTDEALEHLSLAIVLGVFLGGRLGFVLQSPRDLLAAPALVFRVWEGGMAFFGGLLGVVLAIFIVAQRHGLSMLALTDVGAFPAALGLAVGRIANFINGELVGRPTGSDWGVIFPAVDALPRHPSQLYESASHFLLFGILVLAVRLRPAWARGRSGRISALFLCGYGLLRVLTDFYRADDVYFGALSAGQWVSLATFAVGLAWLWAIRRPRAASPAPQ